MTWLPWVLAAAFALTTAYCAYAAWYWHRQALGWKGISELWQQAAEAWQRRANDTPVESDAVLMIPSMDTWTTWN